MQLFTKDCFRPKPLTHSVDCAYHRFMGSLRHIGWNKRLDWKTNERWKNNGCIMSRKNVGYEVKRSSDTSPQSLMVIRVNRSRCSKAKADERTLPLFGLGWEWMALLLVWPYAGESAAVAGAKPTNNGSSVSRDTAYRNTHTTTNQTNVSRLFTVT